MTEVSVIIPNWNGVKLLPWCLSSVFAQNFKNFEVILVDNGSVDDSVAFTKKNYPKVKIIQLPKNLGFAAAVNRGVAKSTSAFIALLNNDAAVNVNWLSKLYEAILVHPEVVAVAPKILQAGNSKLIDNAGDKMNIVGQASPIGKGERNEKFNRAGFVFGASGAASLFRREILLNLGSFDEDFFFYFEDVDFSLRAQIAGYRFWYEPAAQVFHQGAATASKLGTFVQFQRFRNTIFLVIKNFPLQLFLKRGRWWKIPLVWFHTFYFFVKKKMLWQALRVLFDLPIYFPRLLKKRRKNMKRMKVSIDYLDNLMEDKKLKIFGMRL